MNPGQKKVVQYLDEAHASEQALIRVLQSQIAMTPRGSYRSSLEAHLGQTRDHAKRVALRLEALDRGSNPLTAVIGVAESVLGQALALGKTPFDLVRGSGGEEKVLKNAKDAAATEALEIATYTTIEHLAQGVGDGVTAELAASIRTDEEQMLERIMREIPKLTEAVVGADVKDEPSYDVSDTGAADAVRKAADTAKNGARKKTAAATRTAASKHSTAPKRRARRTASEHDELRAAAEAGDATAAFTLWTQLRENDFAAAERWLRKAADLGEPRAVQALGMLLWERQDLDGAEATLRSAAADPEGAHTLGLLLWRGRHDLLAAVEPLDRAAQADDPAAQRDLGFVLRERGDLHGAHYWLGRAAERDGDARQALAALEL